MPLIFPLKWSKVVPPSSVKYPEGLTIMHTLSLNTQVNLRLLLVSGKSYDFLFEPGTSATEIAEYVFANWPSGNHHLFWLIDLSYSTCIYIPLIYQ